MPSIEPRRLVAAADIETAIAWRLEGLDADKVGQLAMRVGTLPADLNETHPAVAQMLRELKTAFPEDRREPWTLLCAVVARTRQNCADAVFWGAGMSVVGAYRKSRQKPGNRVGDSLTSLIAEYLRRHPADTPAQIFDCFVGVAELGCDPVLVDYNPDRDALVFQPNPDRETFDEITRDSFYRRCRRIAATSPDNTIADVREAA